MATAYDDYLAQEAASTFGSYQAAPEPEPPIDPGYTLDQQPASTPLPEPVPYQAASYEIPAPPAPYVDPGYTLDQQPRYYYEDGSSLPMPDHIANENAIFAAANARAMDRGPNPESRFWGSGPYEDGSYPGGTLPGNVFARGGYIRPLERDPYWPEWSATYDPADDIQPVPWPEAVYDPAIWNQSRPPPTWPPPSNGEF